MVEYDFSYRIWDFGAISYVPKHFHLHQDLQLQEEYNFEKLTAAIHFCKLNKKKQIKNVKKNKKNGRVLLPGATRTRDS